MGYNHLVKMAENSLTLAPADAVPAPLSIDVRPSYFMIAYRSVWLLLLLSLSLAGCLPYISVSLAIDSADVQTDIQKTAGVLRSLGFTDAQVSDSAPKGAIGFRAYQGQFTIVKPDQTKHRIEISFGEVANEFSPRAKLVYANMLSALRAEFSNARVEASNELAASVGSNMPPNTDLAQKPAPGRLALRWAS